MWGSVATRLYMASACRNKDKGDESGDSPTPKSRLIRWEAVSGVTNPYSQNETNPKDELGQGSGRCSRTWTKRTISRTGLGLYGIKKNDARRWAFGVSKIWRGK